MKPGWHSKIIASALALALFGLAQAAPAEAVIYTYDLGDHPNSASAPPPYGLRLDGAEWWATGNGGNSDAWTFSFNPLPADCGSCGMIGTLNTGAGTFTIKGTALGGRDIGAGYANPGPGKLLIDFTYKNVNVGSFNGHPSVSVFGDPHGTGTVTFLDNNQSITAGTVIDLLGYPPGMKPFKFKADDHRLDALCPGHEACDNPVGRGWLKFVEYDGSGSIIDSHKTSYQDWLFTSKRQEIPEPSTLALFGFGLLGLGILQRRRRRG